MHRLLESLNPVQREAVLHTEGPLVIFAGAGSGKTRIITTRMAWLMEQGVYPWQILAVTFTNKASKEMSERVNQLRTDAKNIHIGTFHSACARWLREFAEELGFGRDFSIYDDKDSLSALKAVIEQLGLRLQGPEGSAAEFRQAIARAKVRGWFPQDASEKMSSCPGFPTGAAEVYRKYQEYLARCNAMDFNDLLMNMLLLLQKNKQVRERLRKRYRYIMIDEYQDTNPTQFALISALVPDEPNLCVVGDDDQSIYSWRGADPGNILGFKSRYPNAREVRLEQNYRCTANIINAAAGVIRHNKVRAEKVLWTENPPGERLSEDEYYDGDLEGSMIAESLRNEAKAYPFSRCAVFYRTNAQSRLIEESLRRQNIPYRIYGALRFYDRAEIKDILAWIRMILNPADDIAFQRLINTPPRGIGARAMEAIKETARNRHSSLYEGLRTLATQTPPIPRKTAKFQLFIEEFEALTATCLSSSPDKVAGLILSETGYGDWLRKKDPDLAGDKMANIHELGAAMADYHEAYPEATLADWLKDVSLSGSEDESEEGGVSLMTLHSAKGLEFDRVYITGMEDKLLPHINAMDDPGQLEEERRLFYVGMTRAKKKLSLSYARRRRMFNQWVAHRPSRFLREIPAGLVQEAPGSQPAPSGITPAGPPTGSFVSHPTFGRGTVRSLEAGDRYTKALVQFKEFGQRMVPVHHLRQISGG